MVSSYSGNTEEVLSFYRQIIENDLPHIVITTGGKLEQLALQNGSPIYKIPGGIQPRLSTGYFIAGIVQILINCDVLPGGIKEMMLKASTNIGLNFNEEDTKELAKELLNKVPIIYSTDNNSSLACLSKIKFNENSKIQAFWNYFPELNHNEMVGYTNMVMNPFFIIFQSQFTNARNLKRIEIFRKLMKEKDLDSYLFELKGNNVLEEILMAYYFIDHVTYYLAELYGIDPEPVVMVEDFKKLLEG
jgi:glucose/mannose-6-phosphate isomerase